MIAISSFYGITVRMFFSEHAPPHFHARYGDAEATIDIERLHVVKGELPRRALELALDWAELHRQELVENWHLCRENLPPRAVEPLV